WRVDGLQLLRHDRPAPEPRHLHDPRAHRIHASAWPALPLPRLLDRGLAQDELQNSVQAPGTFDQQWMGEGRRVKRSPIAVFTSLIGGSLTWILTANVSRNALLERLPRERDLCLAVHDAVIVGTFRLWVLLAVLLVDALPQRHGFRCIVAAILDTFVISPGWDFLAKA